MKVYELLEKKANFRTSNKSIDAAMTHTDFSTNDDIIGQSTITYLHKRFPNKVIKFVSLNGPQDPEYQFYRLCMNHQDNPFFPRIYSLKIYNHPGDQDAHQQLMTDYHDVDYASLKKDKIAIVVTEKLYPITENDKDLLDAVKIHNDISILSGKRKFWSDYKTRINKPEKRKPIISDTEIAIEYRKAMRLLEPLFKKFHQDLHLGNFMVRHENGLRHLVINDPISPHPSHIE